MPRSPHRLICEWECILSLLVKEQSTVLTGMYVAIVSCFQFVWTWNPLRWCCDGLSENGPQRLIYLNVWSPGGGTVWGRWGGVSSLVCLWGLAFVQPSNAICHLCMFFVNSSQLLCWFLNCVVRNTVSLWYSKGVYLVSVPVSWNRALNQHQLVAS